jgi:hypothetical protein
MILSDKRMNTEGQFSNVFIMGRQMRVRQYCSQRECSALIFLYHMYYCKMYSCIVAE